MGHGKDRRKRLQPPGRQHRITSYNVCYTKLLRLDAFETRVKDLIAYDASLGLPNNLDEARLRGAELRADATLWDWTLAGSRNNFV